MTHRPFTVFGSTIDFILVDRESLNPRPLVAEVMAGFGAVGAHRLEREFFTWKSRPQPHMIRLQSNQSMLNLNAMDHGLADEIRLINRFLESQNARLMPGGVHPWALAGDLKYNQATRGQRFFSNFFSCQGHGWTNVCSTYLDLPFEDDDALTRLNAAARVILPLVPALSASSPILEGCRTAWLSNRFDLEIGRFSEHPVVCGSLIPEPYFTENRYRESIFHALEAEFPSDHKSGQDNEPVSPERINRRGVVPFFSGKFLRMRMIDPQECPAADMAVFKLVIEGIRALVQERFVTLEEQMNASMGDLTGILRDAASTGMKAEVISSGYLAFFGMQAPATIGDIWRKLFDHLAKDPVRPLAMYEHELSVILNQGSLADRILTMLGDNPRQEDLHAVWQRLCDCLDQNRLLIL